MTLQSDIKLVDKLLSVYHPVTPKIKKGMEAWERIKKDLQTNGIQSR